MGVMFYSAFPLNKDCIEDVSILLDLALPISYPEIIILKKQHIQCIGAIM